MTVRIEAYMTAGNRPANFKFNNMKTYANNPAVDHTMLNNAQRWDAFAKIGTLEKMNAVDVSYNYTYDLGLKTKYEFFITSPTSVAVRKKK